VRASQRASVAALTRVAREGGAAVSSPARAARLATFEVLADPDGTLEPTERARRSAALLRAEMVRLQQRSLIVRRERAGARSAVITLERCVKELLEIAVAATALASELEGDAGSKTE
jgi:hypothetical protein